MNKIASYKGNKIGKKEIKEATDKDVEEELQKLIEKATTTVEKEGPALKGDIVNIDYEGFLNGTPFAGGKGENYDLELGSNTFIPGFEDQLINTKKGDKVDVNVTFPEKYQSADLAGKAVVFKCVVHEVKEKQKPECDDELAKKYRFDNLEALKEELKKQVNARNRHGVISSYVMTLMTYIADHSEIEIKDEALADRLNQMLSYYDQQMRSYGMDLKSYLSMSNMTEDQFKESLKPQVLLSLKSDIIYDEVVKNENITVSDEELNMELAFYKKAYNFDDANYEEFKKENSENIRRELTFRKVNDKLFEWND